MGTTEIKTFSNAQEAPMRTITVRKAIYEAMAQEMRRDPAVFLMGEEVAQYQGAYKISQGLLEEFGPKRVVDTPISEYGFTGIGVGAAFRGLRPIVEFMSFNFSMQAIDHIINSAAKTLYMSGGSLGCPIVFRGPNGAAASVGAQHSQCYASWYAHCPGLKVVAPYDAISTKTLLRAAIRDPNPVIFLENEILYGRTFSVPALDCEEPIPLLDEGPQGQKAIVRRQGRHVTLVTFSLMVEVALHAAEEVFSEGIDVCVIDLCVLRPWDRHTVQESIKKTHRLVTLEEGWPTCGIGAEVIAEMVESVFDSLDAPPVRVTGKDVPMPYAKNLETLALPTVAEVAAALRHVCGANTIYFEK